MNDDLDQLLRNLRLHRIREIIEREIDRADNAKKKPSYTEFVARLLREQYQHQRERGLLYRISSASTLPSSITRASSSSTSTSSPSTVAPTRFCRCRSVPLSLHARSRRSPSLTPPTRSPRRRVASCAASLAATSPADSALIPRALPEAPTPPRTTGTTTPHSPPRNQIANQIKNQISPWGQLW